MPEVRLLDVKIENITYNNRIVVPNDETLEVQIGTNISTTVSYDDQNAKCKCIMEVNVTPINTSVEFNAVIRVVGVLAYTEGANHREIHVAACKRLFPHVQSSVASFMTLVGLPNFLVGEPELSENDVNVER